MKEIIIAIDGYSGCGKSTTAKEVASKIGYKYIDSGAMYRAVTYYFLHHQVNYNDQSQVIEALNDIHIDFIYDKQNKRYETFLNGSKIEDEIRKGYISDNVSEVSAILEVREALVEKQRSLSEQGGIVMDGRDIGTVVFPDADLKIFMTADLQVRAKRRLKDLIKLNEDPDLGEIMENLKSRDKMDSSRDISPLRKADDAIVVDTTNLTFDQQVKRIVELAQKKQMYQ